MLLRSFIVAVGFSLIPVLSMAASLERLALVVGNSDYKASPLANPENDAEDMAQALEKNGFTVTLLKNASKRQMDGAIRYFERSLVGKDKVGLFFYAGHAVEIEGQNYLIPLNADIQVEEDVKYNAVNVGRLLAGMEAAGNGLNMVVLDACRDNPYNRGFRSANRGLTKMNAPKGSMILYAAQPGDVASDGKGRNGTFTKHLLAAIDKPGLKIEEVFKQTAVGVNQETGGKQIPWVEGVILGDFYFTIVDEVTVSSEASINSDMEIIYWNDVKDSGNPELLQSYLNQYSDGNFVEIAKIKLRQLEPELQPAIEPSNFDVSVMLTKCNAHFDANRLTSGAGGTALNCYRDVLSRDRGNSNALDGLVAIEQKYKDWIETAINTNRLEKAQQYLLSLKKVNPKSGFIRILESQFDKKENNSKTPLLNTTSATSQMDLSSNTTASTLIPPPTKNDSKLDQRKRYSGNWKGVIRLPAWADAHGSQFDLVISKEDDNSAHGRVVAKYVSSGALPVCDDAKVKLSNWTVKSVRIELTGAFCTGSAKLKIKGNTIMGRIQTEGANELSYIKFKKID